MGLVQILALCACVLLAGPACRRAAELTADRLDVTLKLLADGSVEVRETLVIRGGERSTDTVVRRVPADRVDAFIDVTASIDGRRIDQDGSDGRIRVRRSGGLEVEWRLAPGVNASQTLMLAYRAIGVVGVEGERGKFRWPVLPIGSPVGIDSARVELLLPAGSVLLDTPVVTEGGWAVKSQGGGAVAERGPARSREGATLSADVTVDRMGVAEPVWQYRASRASQLRPAFLSAGASIVAVGLGIVWMVRLQYPRPKAGPGTEPPPDLAPALRLAVLHGRRVRGVPEIVAAVQDLVTRARPAAPLEHERLVLEELLPGDRPGPASATTPWAGRLTRGLRRRFRRALSSDLIAAGLVDADRVSVGGGLRAAGHTVLFTGLFTSVLVPGVLGTYGAWAMALPVSLVVVGATLFGASANFRILTEAGEHAAAALRGKAP
jgi:hypothetical protein